jgi:hypothetical protein
MPYEYTISPAQRLVRLRMWGMLSRAEILTAVSEVAADPGLAPGFSEIVDLSAAPSVEAISAEDIKALAMGVVDGISRRAFVAPDLATFGLARMFGAMRESTDTAERVAVFRTIEEAESWLGLKGT